MHRWTASAAYAAPAFAQGTLALAAIWGRNVEQGHGADSALLEANLDLDGRNAPFMRLEYVRKSGHDLVVGGDPEARYDLFQAQLGYAHRFTGGPVVPVIGAALDVAALPGSLEGAYGTRVPLGAFFFVGLQPPQAGSGQAHGGHPR